MPGPGSIPGTRFFIMKLFNISKDGGPDSNVTGYWLIEWKRFFSIALLRFSDGSRESFHSHAFNCGSWVLTGGLREENLDGTVNYYRPGLKPLVTLRNTFHRVFSHGTSWVLTFRGPWAKTWSEFDPASKTFSVLSGGRVVEKTFSKAQ